MFKKRVLKVRNEKFTVLTANEKANLFMPRWHGEADNCILVAFGFRFGLQILTILQRAVLLHTLCILRPPERKSDIFIISANINDALVSIESIFIKFV